MTTECQTKTCLPGEGNHSWPGEYLKLIASVSLGPTKGEKTLYKCAHGYGNLHLTTIWDSRFSNDKDINVEGQDTSEIPVEVYELVRDGSFRNIFESLDILPEHLCLSQGQIIEFGNCHRVHLGSFGFGAYFLFDTGPSKLFLAHLDYAGRYPIATVARFPRPDNTGASERTRFVFPARRPTPLPDIQQVTENHRATSTTLVF